MTYLANLTKRLAGGLQRVTPEFRARHTAFLFRQIRDDGAFAGRGGGADLYYTGFGLRGLAALGRLDPATATLCAGWLRTRLKRDAGVIDFVSLLYSAALLAAGGGPDVLAEARADWGAAVAGAVEGFRSPDGGYAKTPDNASGSTYHSFLVALALQLAGRGIPDPARAAAFVLSRRRDDGGFVEIAPMRRSGTNPTAAAMGLLTILAPGEDVLPEAEGARVLEGVTGFLAPLQSPVEGGWRANRVAPVADLLSTFTALLTLCDLQAADRVDWPAVGDFLSRCEMPGGGFRAGLWDDAADVEYTFYGLGVAALSALHGPGAAREPARA